MIEGLAGYTGFVGGNLFKKGNFNYLFNSKNIENLPNFSIDNLYFCAVGAEKWRINKEPKKDLEQINQQLNLLRKSKFERLILISTIDVYSRRDGINELCEETHYMNDISYGGNRRYFEKILLDEFKDVKIIRLPALFGDGLKKNIIFDLLQENMLKNINLNSTFQWYFLGNLFDDIAKVISLYPDQKVFNFFTELLN